MNNLDEQIGTKSINENESDISYQWEENKE